MRNFLPLTAEELNSPTPPGRKSVEALPPADLKGEALELFYEEALAEAAFDSLALVLADSSALPARVVAIGVGPIAEWSDVDSFQVDDGDVRRLIAAARLATTQEELDELVADICDSPLAWYDATELADLRRQAHS
ncbi:hypothetical protein VRY54_07320 [Actinomyces sp. F1_1611]